MVGERNDSLKSYSLTNAVNTYHNYYHFLEVPISLKVQLSSKKVPLYWDAGVLISQLISSNALQLNDASAAYSQNNSFFNKLQTGFSTGFSASLFSKRKTSVLIGPYIYYGSSKVAHEGLYKDQHFTFVSLRTQVSLKK